MCIVQVLSQQGSPAKWSGSFMSMKIITKKSDDVVVVDRKIYAFIWRIEKSQLTVSFFVSGKEIR